MYEINNDIDIYNEILRVRRGFGFVFDGCEKAPEEPVSTLVVCGL